MVLYKIKENIRDVCTDVALEMQRDTRNTKAGFDYIANLDWKAGDILYRTQTQDDGNKNYWNFVMMTDRVCPEITRMGVVYRKVFDHHSLAYLRDNVARWAAARTPSRDILKDYDDINELAISSTYSKYFDPDSLKETYVDWLKRSDSHWGVAKV